jgi:hypothetical protein
VAQAATIIAAAVAATQVFIDIEIIPCLGSIASRCLVQKNARTGGQCERTLSDLRLKSPQSLSCPGLFSPPRHSETRIATGFSSQKPSLEKYLQQPGKTDTHNP